MNCINLFLERAIDIPNHPALCMPGKHVYTFQDLSTLAVKTQRLLRKCHIKKGDGILLVDSLGPRMYGAVIGILGMGCHVILVEPWMPLQKINHAVSLAQPKLFLTSWPGMLWGLRSKAVRSIKSRERISKVKSESGNGSLAAEEVSKEDHGIITFTSGTTGNPKGVVRNQGFLFHQHRVITRALQADRHQGSDLCIFANFVLTNLASGRCSIIVPPSWRGKFLREADNLPESLSPKTLTCGPAFLKRLMEHGSFSSLESIHVGGALTDCVLFEKAFTQWPEAEISHIYGSSEAEPVAISDARSAVGISRQNGYFQTLNLGRPIEEVKTRLEESSLWVSGNHVSPFYLGDEVANQLHKRKDSEGTIWHDMGDRIIKNDQGWWYSGRSSQCFDEFKLEQEIYSFLQSSSSFIYRRKDGTLFLCGEGIENQRNELTARFPVLDEIVELKIYRDKRHRARIDRKTSMQKGAKWIVG